MPRASSAIAEKVTPTDTSALTHAQKRRDTSPKPRRSKASSPHADIAGARARGVDTSTYEGAESVSPDKPLTEKQKLFVKFWAEGNTILSASYKAGYADGGAIGYRLVRMPNVLALYQREKALYEEAAQMSRKRVMDMLLEAYDTAKMVAEPSSMVSAAKEIGKMCGYYEPVTVRHEHSVEGQVVHRRMEAMSDEDLLRFIAERAGQIASDPAGAPNSTTPALPHVELVTPESDGAAA